MELVVESDDVVVEEVEEVGKRRRGGRKERKRAKDHSESEQRDRPNGYRSAYLA